MGVRTTLNDLRVVYPCTCNTRRRSHLTACLGRARLRHGEVRHTQQRRRQGSYLPLLAMTLTKKVARRSSRTISFTNSTRRRRRRPRGIHHHSRDGCARPRVGELWAPGEEGWLGERGLRDGKGGRLDRAECLRMSSVRTLRVHVWPSPCVHLLSDCGHANWLQVQFCLRRPLYLPRARPRMLFPSTRCRATCVVGTFMLDLPSYLIC